MQLKKPILLLAASLSLVLNACDTTYWLQSQVRASSEPVRKIRVGAIIQSPSFMGNKKAYKGLDYDLSQDFAKTQHLQLEYKVYKNQKELFWALKENQIEMAIGRFLPSDIESMEFLPGPSLESSSFSLFCNKKIRSPQFKDFADETVGVPHGQAFDLFYSQYEQELHFINLLKVDDSLKTSFSLITEDKLSCAVAETMSGRHNVRFYPDVREAEVVLEDVELAWAVSAEASDLHELLASWHKSRTRSNVLMLTQAFYFDHLQQISFQDVSSYYRRLDDKLPSLEKEFKAAAAQSHLPWELIAAVAYQESHWESHAKNVSGAEGIMQIIQPTAELFGLTDRTNVRESILAGAKYLRYILKSLPRDIPLMDRYSFMLASYNVGPYHLKDAQVIALKLGKNPYSWNDVKRTLPLLADPKYFTQVKFGYARGMEPVIYTERIRNFYEILKEYSARPKKTNSSGKALQVVAK